MLHTRPRPRTFALRLALGALVLLCVQIGVYLLILEDTVGGVSLLRAAPPSRGPIIALPARAVVLRSDTTASLWSAEAYGQRLSTWTAALESVGFPYSVVGEAALDGSLHDATVLVLPGAACLGEPARASIRAHLERGRGLVATGALGSRNTDCSWRGFDLLAELTGASRVEAVALPGAVFAAFRGGEFSESAVPAGYRLELPYQELVFVQTPRPALLASDWRLRPARKGGAGESGLAVHRQHGPGRVAWLGFDESGAGRRQAAQGVLESYLAASAAWASRQPIATVATWPGRRPAAATVIVVGGQPRETAALAGALRETGVAGAYVPSGDLPQGGLAWDGELATAGEGEEPFAGQPLDVQRRRLDKARAALEAAGSGRIAGFMPPAGATDGATLRAVAAAGLSYTVGEVAGLRATPERVEIPSRFLSVLPGRPVVRLFNVAADDQEVLARPGDPAAAFIRELERVTDLGGLYPLLLHADLAGREELLPAVRAVLAEASRRGLWLAPASEVARWWSAKEGLHVSAKRLSPYRIQVDLGNHGQEDARDVVVSVYLPHVPERVGLRSPVLRLAMPATERDGDVLRLHFAEVTAQSNHTYVVSVDE